ncbi:HNH endonuclease [Rhodococcus antarcticus]|uniref:HNH endonuclease n=1 Tax=Rhodococcus antarcticus TaxID=2987751 RepID=A0ABY6NWT9_9NOCA|nr:HNH endonuclease [Rhodococcus antarcticus]UZJ23704.1 HNH endonuclease [Rhodococcus antarcticus]
MDRACESCGGDLAHKRRDARFCNRTCKMAYWHQLNRTSPEGKASERARNLARYAREAESRKAGALAYYWENQQVHVEYSRQWRADNPHRRREQYDRRADLILNNPGFVAFGAKEWGALKRQYDHRCAYCGTRPEKLEMDHVIPVTRGGRHAIANILPSCPACNRSKFNYLLSEWRLRQSRR